jgi:SET domain-containing protein
MKYLILFNTTEGWQYDSAVDTPLEALSHIKKECAIAYMGEHYKRDDWKVILRSSDFDYLP